LTDVVVIGASVDFFLGRAGGPAGPPSARHDVDGLLGAAM
jgi:hypothetical protein